MKLFVITSETFLLLRRDKVFLPALVCGAVIFIFANLASEWGIEEFTKILYDMGTLGFHITGAIVAIFWGTKLISDSRREGSLEVQLASPVNRITWILGRYFGLCLALFALGSVLLVAWQIMTYFNNFGIMELRYLIIFGFFMLSWFVLAALALLFASMASQAVAMFSALCVWIAGLMSASVAATLSPNTPASTRFFIEKVKMIWNLQAFNLSDYVDIGAKLPATGDLVVRLMYGFLLIAVLLTIAVVSFNKRDLAGNQ